MEPLQVPLSRPAGLRCGVCAFRGGLGCQQDSRQQDHLRSLCFYCYSRCFLSRSGEYVGSAKVTWGAVQLVACKRRPRAVRPITARKETLCELQGKALASASGPVAVKYNGMLGTMATIAREEGVASLWKGLTPGLHRQCVFGGLRIGLYDPVKTLFVGKDHQGDVPLLKKIGAALTTGAIGISVANPTDLVKVRLQSEGRLPAGVPRRYSGAMNAYATIIKQEGFTALWTGVGPNIARNAIVNAAELASYDQIKETLLALPSFEDNVVTHLCSGLGAGFVAVCVGSPVDVCSFRGDLMKLGKRDEQVKSRVMGDHQGQYRGTIDCFIKTFRNDGMFAFYKGFIPNFGRLGSWNVIMFLTLEQVLALVPCSSDAVGTIECALRRRVDRARAKGKASRGVLTLSFLQWSGQCKKYFSKEVPA